MNRTTILIWNINTTVRQNKTYSQTLVISNKNVTKFIYTSLTIHNKHFFPSTYFLTQEWIREKEEKLYLYGLLKKDEIEEAEKEEVEFNKLYAFWGRKISVLGGEKGRHFE